MMLPVRSCRALLSWLRAAAWAADVPQVAESARQIPVAYDVDVVVVGGGTGAVSAAVAAAEAGAKVFLAAPHPYLGDDMTATLRLWLEPGEDADLAAGQADLRRRGAAAGRSRNRIAFTYTADAASDANAQRHHAAAAA